MPLYVGSSDGRVHELNITTGVDTKQYTLGNTVGDISTETSTEIFAPTSAGKIYKIPAAAALRRVMSLRRSLPLDRGGGPRARRWS